VTTRLFIREVLPLAPARSPQQVGAQRGAAREALRECARKCGAPIKGWVKNAADVPLSNDGWFWSIAHKRRYAVAAISDRPVGVDIEELAARPRRLHGLIASEEEWRILGDNSWHSFFRLFTAKEAVLKKHGCGIGRLLECRVAGIDDAGRMVLAFSNHDHVVIHRECDKHIIAVSGGDTNVRWMLPDAEP